MTLFLKTGPKPIEILLGTSIGYMMSEVFIYWGWVSDNWYQFPLAAFIFVVLLWARREYLDDTNAVKKLERDIKAGVRR